MPERQARHGAPWQVEVVPAGTAGEAALAAERARRLVAGWLRAGTVGAGASGLFQGTVASGGGGLFQGTVATGAGAELAGDGVRQS